MVAARAQVEIDLADIEVTLRVDGKDVDLRRVLEIWERSRTPTVASPVLEAAPPPVTPPAPPPAEDSVVYPHATFSVGSWVIAGGGRGVVVAILSDQQNPLLVKWDDGTFTAPLPSCTFPSNDPASDNLLDAMNEPTTTPEEPPPEVVQVSKSTLESLVTQLEEAGESNYEFILMCTERMRIVQEDVIGLMHADGVMRTCAISEFTRLSRQRLAEHAYSNTRAIGAGDQSRTNIYRVRSIIDGILNGTYR